MGFRLSMAVVNLRLRIKVRKTFDKGNMSDDICDCHFNFNHLKYNQVRTEIDENLLKCPNF